MKRTFATIALVLTFPINSILPAAPKGVALKDFLPKPDFVDGEGLLLPAFVKLRAEADAWQSARTDFMLKRLKAGRHPDTDAQFWEGYVEPPAPGLPTESVLEHHYKREDLRQRLSLLVIAGVPAVTLVFMLGSALLRSRRARRRKARHVSDQFS